MHSYEIQLDQMVLEVCFRSQLEAMFVILILRQEDLELEVSLG